MSARRTVVSAYALFALVIAPSQSRGQTTGDAGSGTGTGVAAAAGSIALVYRTMDFPIRPDSTATVSQIATPFHAWIPVRPNMDLVVTTGAAFSTVDFAGESRLYGVSDTKLKGTARLYDDRVLVSLGLGMPTGLHKLTPAEAFVAQALSQSLLGFRAKSLGEGFDVDLGAAFARSLGPASSLAAGIGYLRKGAYTLLAEDEDDYNPGDEVTLTGGFDAAGELLFVRADAALRLFGTDELGGREVFQEGVRFELDQLFVVSWPEVKLTFHARESLAGEQEVFADTTAVQTASTDGPTDIWIGLTAARFFELGARRVEWEGSVSYSRFGSSDLELGDGHVAGIGTGVRVPLGFRIDAQVAAEILSGEGRVGEGAVAGDVSGAGVSVGLAHRLGGGR